MRTLSSVILLILMLAACGLKGPLYLPQDQDLPSDQQKTKIEGQKN